MSIPHFDQNGNLPPGIHLATWQEVQNSLAFNVERQRLLDGLKLACESLKLVNCRRIYIGGSFVTSKLFPNDFDVCWDDHGVNFVELRRNDPVLLDFKNKRAAQKAKYGGELFMASNIADSFSRKTYLEFFQQDRQGNSKGIIAIDL